jgi:hypothetical protein
MLLCICVRGADELTATCDDEGGTCGTTKLTFKHAPRSV